MNRLLGNLPKTTDTSQRANTAGTAFSEGNLGMLVSTSRWKYRAWRTTNWWRRKWEERKSWQAVETDVHPAASIVALPGGFLLSHGSSCDGNSWAMACRCGWSWAESSCGQKHSMCDCRRKGGYKRTHHATQKRWVLAVAAVIFVSVIFSEAKWSLGLLCTPNKCKCHCYDLFFSVSSAHSCHLRFWVSQAISRPGEAGTGRLLFYVSGICFLWQKPLILCGGGWQSSGSGMVWEASIRMCIYFFILCCLESYSRLRAVSILWLFSGWMWWHRIARSVSSKCPSTLCVYAWQDAFTFFVNLTNRRSVWAAKHVTNYRKWGWMGLRSPSIFLFPNFMRNQLELGHSHLP